MVLEYIIAKCLIVDYQTNDVYGEANQFKAAIE